ncbi:MAG: filamentous hemagglutinin N-terminal domain-containing protein [Nostoc sp. DedQUE12b]|uniref:two-partner secretion domain-containing protein n=1 Tax=Nostoc sp. DedQUE12b TaxID=3075398 RepID=UPI002AD1D279|nr:filamentous hemagglutinin N-terminal domain-containing protein [Nostoc sp. DedQUE12b]MDZ8085419.1 filamentous hemagglutinin N-terminal domain-containing protein [Nostoc sp. DedQUE12b]
MSNLWVWFKSLGFAVCGAIAFCGNSAIAQITPDGTLPTNSQVTSDGNMTNIEGGTRAGNNLFHSFEQFSVPPGITAYFKNPGDIQNFISRVTGNSISKIEGILRADGTANVFLINPNGIIFGENASLQISGSFVASTASSLNFADGTKFSATDPRTTPLLTVSVPIGLQFGATAAPIRNQSRYPNQDNPVGLQVQPDKTLALVGGDITLEGGNLTATSGRIELGSVAANSLVSLNPTVQGWVLGYEGVQNFQNIKLMPRTVNGSDIPSQVNANNKDSSGGNIQVQGNTVKLIGYGVELKTQATGVADGGDLTINATNLIVQDGAAVSTATIGEGNGGKLTVNASDLVEVIGSSPEPGSDYIVPSQLFSSTAVAGKAGELSINTKRLRIQNGGQVSTDSIGFLGENSQSIPGKGAGGDLIVNASESIELIGTSISNFNVTSGLFALTNTSGDAGKVIINTGKLIIQDRAELTVSSQKNSGYTYPDGYILGKAGDVDVIAGSILLDNQGKLTSNSESGQGGNIMLKVRDLLLMRRNSEISTNAAAKGDGGQITINAPNGFVVATPFGNNDITANANFGSGGKITITAKNIFGFVPRSRTDLERLLNTKDPEQLKPSNLPTSDITAFSQQDPSLNGTVRINSPDADPSKGLVELPVNLVDASQQIAASCSSGGKIARNSFITTGRGGLVADPTQPLIADDAVLADWITLKPESQNRAGSILKRAVVQAQRNTEKKSQKVNYVNEPTQIVEAQGWIIDANGNVVLVAQVPTTTPHNSSLTAPSCADH